MAVKYINKINEWEGDNTQPYPSNYIWEKEYLYPFLVTFNCARVIAKTDDRTEYFDELEAYKRLLSRNLERISGLALGGSIGENTIGELEINGDFLEEVVSVPDYSGDFNLSIKFYVDDLLIFTKEVYSLSRPFRIPGGIKGRKFKIRVEGNVTVKKVDMATSMRELMR